MVFQRLSQPEHIFHQGITLFYSPEITTWYLWGQITLFLLVNCGCLPKAWNVCQNNFTRHYAVHFKSSLLNSSREFKEFTEAESVSRTKGCISMKNSTKSKNAQISALTSALREIVIIFCKWSSRGWEMTKESQTFKSSMTSGLMDVILPL